MLWDIIDIITLNPNQSASSVVSSTVALIALPTSLRRASDSPSKTGLDRELDIPPSAVPLSCEGASPVAGLSCPLDSFVP
jgi:hypothetical protein